MSGQENTSSGSDVGGIPNSDLSTALGQGNVLATLDVSLSNEVVHLLSEQLYTSPLKAIEEIVANAYDADAEECRIALLLDGMKPSTPLKGADDASVSGEVVSDMDVLPNGVSAPTGVIAIYDDGSGMDLDGLRGLWRVGNSPKKNETKPTTKFNRKIVGKFGIGKLATYAVANRITYITSTPSGVLHVLCDFRDFSKSDLAGKSPPVTLSVREIKDLTSLLSRDDLKNVLSKLDLDPQKLASGPNLTWTICLLDELKPKAQDLKIGRLSWVLRTAMPLKTDFRIYLNGSEQKSSKEDHKKVYEFNTGDIDDDRIASINRRLGVHFSKTGNYVVEQNLFPSGIRGSAFVTEATLIGKSDSLIGRSHGFFVRVRERVVNLDDPLFHNTPISHGTFNRFRADLDIDDLHHELTAPREGIGVGRRRDIAAAFAREIGLQARDAFEAWQRQKSDQKLAPEDTRIYVAEHLVERPVADALVMYGNKNAGGDVDKKWIYVEEVPSADLSAVVKQLYEKRTRYKFRQVPMGREARLAKFEPSSATFTLNADHQLVKAFADDPRSKELLDLVAATEVMLEIYMAESGVQPFIIGEILNRRDSLFRSLAEDQVYSREALASMLRQSADDSIQLELSLIAAVRSLGFQAKHIAGSGEPDGIARFLNSSMHETVITLEAKASQGTPSLGALDFSGLVEHKLKSGATGCLLVAPSYPGASDPSSAVANRSSDGKISCWTVEQLAMVVEAAEKREITTEQISRIVSTSFTPLDVSRAVEDLLSAGTDMHALYRGVISILKQMFARKNQPGDTRKISAITAVLGFNSEFPGITEDIVRKAVVDLAHHSKGGMGVREDVIIFYTDFEEIIRRVAPLTGDLGGPRSLGSFKA